MQETVQIVLMVVLVYFIGIATGIGGYFAWRKLSRLGKARILWVDPDLRTVNETFERPSGGSLVFKDRTYLLDGLAKHGGKYATWLINLNTGWNYRALTRAETLDKDIRMAVLEPSNPTSYHRAIHRRRWDDILQAGSDGDKYAWVPMAAVAGLIALLIIMGGVVWIMTHLPSNGGAS